MPIGAVVARGDEVLGAAGNERELRRDPTAHAEVLALRAAAEALGGWRLPETTIYVTLEPCAMCAGAISLARVPRLVFGAADPKGGAAGGVIDLYRAARRRRRSTTGPPWSQGSCPRSPRRCSRISSPPAAVRSVYWSDGVAIALASDRYTATRSRHTIRA